MTTETFSLLDEPWIRCLGGAGTTVELSIRDVFDGSHPVAAIRGEAPTQDYAVLRVLLAIFWRAHHDEAAPRPRRHFRYSTWFTKCWKAIEDGEPDEAVLDYLDGHADRFDLLHPVTPFMQVADLHTRSGIIKNPMEMVPELKDEHFSMRAGVNKESLSFAEAARWLIHTQAYDCAGIKSGAEGDPRVTDGKGFGPGIGWTGKTGGTTIMGRTLAHTILLNTTSQALEAVGDHPVWERAQDTAAQRPGGHHKEGVVPTGPADLLTWQSRRIRLHHNGSVVTGVLISKGDKIPENNGAIVHFDPMTPYKNKELKGKQVSSPAPYNPSCTVWESLDSLILIENDQGSSGRKFSWSRPRNLSQMATLPGGTGVPKIVDLQICSLEYQKRRKAVIIDSVSASLGIPLALLREEAGPQRRIVVDTARATRAAAVALGKFAARLLHAAGGKEVNIKKVPPDDGLLGSLEPPFTRWLVSLPADQESLDNHVTSWQRFVKSRVLEEARIRMKGAGPKALCGHEKHDNKNGKNPDEKIVSAGIAYQWLQNDLRKALPLIDKKEDQKK